MPAILKKTLNVLSYMFRRKGFITKRLVVATVTLMMMLFVDIKCGIWDGVGMCLLVLLSLYVICIYAIRWMDLKKEDEKNKDGILPETTDETATSANVSTASEEKSEMKEDFEENDAATQ